MEVKLMTAEETDLEEILALQYLAYRSEAELVGDFAIQPLTQTMDELRGEYLKGVVLKAVAGEKIVGSVRGRTQDGTLFIGKLMVHPDWQNKGLGKKLLARIEELYPQCRYEFFTSADSRKNIGFYERAGYVEFAKKEFAPGLIMCCLHKQTSENKE